MNKQGFTLIELLVVVLIIGILAAVALPQYEAAVERARMSEGMVNLKAILDAEQRYFQANPNETQVTSRTQIADVDLRGGEWDNAGKVFTTKKFAYVLDGASVSAYRSDDTTNYESKYMYILTSNADGTSRDCKHVSTGADVEVAEQMCMFYKGL